MDGTFQPHEDWDPRTEAVLKDQRAAYDEMRERCPVAYSGFLHWSLFRHEDITRVLHDPETFSNAVSSHLSVPNGMDPPEHTEYRRIIEPYFQPDQMNAFEPACRQIAAELVGTVVERREVDVIAELAQPFSARIQCAFLGWPPHMLEALSLWVRKNQEATLAQDREAMVKIAREFEGYIERLLEERRDAGTDEPDDITTSLLHQRISGRPLRDEEIVSILRNWTVGEVGSITASVGILVHYLAEHPELQRELRNQPALLPAAIDEILRIHGPLVANRRVTTRPVEINRRTIDAGERISLIWVSANRDGRVFEDPDTFRLDRDPSKNLLYGAGIHVCPGAPLARLEMRVVLEEILGRTNHIERVPHQPPENAVYPAGGFATLPVRFRSN